MIFWIIHGLQKKNPTPSVEFHHLQKIQVAMDAFIAGCFGRHSQNEAGRTGRFSRVKGHANL